jgi:hypothetical protein
MTAPVMLGAALILAAATATADTIPMPVALLQGLDKTTARVSDFAAPVGSTVHFGTLAITVRDCETNTPEETPDNEAFLQIYDERRDEPPKRVFSGWMFSSSPALSALEHPVYDITVLGCVAANAAAPSKAPLPAAPLPDDSDTGKTPR